MDTNKKCLAEALPMRTLRRFMFILGNKPYSVSVTVVDPCSSNPCKNGATCENRGGNFVCQCRDGWAGPQCTEDSTESKWTNRHLSITLPCTCNMLRCLFYVCINDNIQTKICYTLVSYFCSKLRLWALVRTAFLGGASVRIIYV